MDTLNLEKLYSNFQTIYGFEHLCPLCGNVKEVKCGTAICDELASDWHLNALQRRYYDYREGCACKHCGVTVRIMNFALTLLESINLKYSKVYQFITDVDWYLFADFRLAEINNCGVLHKYLSKVPKLSYSEYGSQEPLVPSEDLMNLSYKDDTFDIVVTSDVLEHVPDYERALGEIARVIKNDGVFIFTVPWLADRKTLRRASIGSNGKTELLQKASYHGDYNAQMGDYLVFHELGYDFVESLQKFFDVKIFCHNGFGGIISSVFVCRGLVGTGCGRFIQIATEIE